METYDAQIDRVLNAEADVQAFADWLWSHHQMGGLKLVPWFNGSEHIVDAFFRATGHQE